MFFWYKYRDYIKFLKSLLLGAHPLLSPPLWADSSRVGNKCKQPEIHNGPSVCERERERERVRTGRSFLRGPFNLKVFLIYIGTMCMHARQPQFES